LSQPLFSCNLASPISQEELGMKDTTSSTRCPKCGGPIPAEALQGICPKCALVAVATPTEAGQPAGEHPPPPPLEAVAAAFPQLEILELIGAGGMGAVFKARQPKLDRLVALKLLSRPLAGDGAFAERFHREARVLARLNHPGIVSVHDYGEAGGFFYLLMEFVDGVNLRQVMRAGRFTPAQALTLVPKVCEALQFAHDEGILHRDIKPENILLDTRGRVKIADFGIAKLIGDKTPGATLTGSGLALGTPHYMAPEQMEHPQDVDQRADIYSLGVVFYEMLTGELPIGSFAPPSAKTPVDPRVDEVVIRALARERERRQRNVTEVKQQVEAITSTPPPAAQATVKIPVGNTLEPEPKLSLCYVSTPEYLRSFSGRFLNIYQAKGELRLQRELLVFSSGWQAVSIPLRSIRTLARGDYPASAKPVPLGYLGVTYEEYGHTRTLLFTPAKSALMLPWETNLAVDEWTAALQEAIRRATGRHLQVESSGAAENWSWSELVKTFLLTAAGCTAAFAMIPLITSQRLPNRLGELVGGPVTAALTMGILLVVRWWRLHFHRLAPAKTAVGQWGRRWLSLPSQVRQVLRTVMALTAVVSVILFASFSSSESLESGKRIHEWSVGAFKPWLQKRQPDPGPGVGVIRSLDLNVASFSFGCGLVALLLGALAVAAYRIESSSQGLPGSVAAGRGSTTGREASPTDAAGVTSGDSLKSATTDRPSKPAVPPLRASWRAGLSAFFSIPAWLIVLWILSSLYDSLGPDGLPPAGFTLSLPQLFLLLTGGGLGLAAMEMGWQALRSMHQSKGEIRGARLAVTGLLGVPAGLLVKFLPLLCAWAARSSGWRPTEGQGALFTGAILAGIFLLLALSAWRLRRWAQT